MQGFLGLIGAVIFFAGIRFVINLVSGTLRATGRTLAGKGSLSENLELTFKGMGPFEARIATSTLNKDGTGPIVHAFEVKGLFPSKACTVETVTFLISVFDDTDDTYVPVLSYLDDFQESDNRVFQCSAP